MMTWAVLGGFLLLKWHFILSVVVQLREILKIRVFHVRSKAEQGKDQ